MATNGKTLETIRKGSDEVQAALRKDMKHFRDETAEFGESLLHAGSDQLKQAKDSLQSQLDSAAKFIQEKPGQSVAIAFAAGLLTSLILGGRR